MSRIGVIIVAGGSGLRMGSNNPKQFLLLDGQPILVRTINNFAAALPQAQIVVVLPAERADYWRDWSSRFEVAPHSLATGGAERFHSVRNGLAALSEDVELVLVQDGVRPLGSRELILRVMAEAQVHGTAIPVTEAVDSFRELVDGRSRVVDRSRLRIVQTPQAFEAELLRRAYTCEFSPDFTDDASVVEAAGQELFLCPGERCNIKITTLEDLSFAEALLAEVTQETQEDGDNL